MTSRYDPRGVEHIDADFTGQAIAEAGTTKSAQFAFGSGSNGFTVTGTDATTIHVTESK